MPKCQDVRTSVCEVRLAIIRYCGRTRPGPVEVVVAVWQQCRRQPGPLRQIL